LITVIPARGASKGILRKNLQRVNGVTLVGRSIRSAQMIPGNSIYLSSDDLEILDIGKEYDVNSIQRSQLNSTDFATSESVLDEVLTYISSDDDLVTLLQPTSPFIDTNSWLKAIKIMNADLTIGSIFSAIDKNVSSWQEVDAKWEPINQLKNVRLPRQLRNKSVVETGSFYLFRQSLFQLEKTRFCGKTLPIISNLWSQFEIDTIEDLSLCNQIAAIID